MRYINKQQHIASCGPVAVMNALKWLGHKIDYRSNIDLFKTLGYHMDRGTYKTGMFCMLRHFGIKFKFKDRICVSDIEEAVDQGYAVILAYHWYNDKKNTRGNHFVFIDRHTDKLIKSKNERSTGGDYGAKKKEYREWFARSKQEGNLRPHMWIIKGIR